VQVTAHLSSAAKLYVHDGAVGSSPSVDVKVRTISDSSSAALILQRILDPAPTRVVSHDAFPLTVYVASNYRLALKTPPYKDVKYHEYVDAGNYSACAPYLTVLCSPTKRLCICKV
jgi:hypothetical protein